MKPKRYVFTEAPRSVTENDIAISTVVDKIMKNDTNKELVKLMNPLDVARIIATNLDIVPQVACKATLDIISKSHGIPLEGFGFPGIETNKQYPVPPTRRKKGGTELKSEGPGGGGMAPGGKTVINPKYVVEPHQFPPDGTKRPRPNDWPYDAMTTAAMTPKNRAPKRGLTAGKDNSDGRTWKQGNKLVPVMKIRGAGGMGGNFTVTYPSKTGDMPGTGRSWTSKGTKGWNSMPHKTFSNPDDDNDQPLRKDPPQTGEALGGGSRNVNPRIMNAGDEDTDTPSFMKTAPVGSAIPTTNFGGRTPKTNNGRRGYRRK